MWGETYDHEYLYDRLNLKKIKKFLPDREFLQKIKCILYMCII